MASSQAVVDEFELFDEHFEGGSSLRIFVLEIEPRGSRYDEERSVREGVLRQPLGLQFDGNEFPFERESIHLVAVTADPLGPVVATVLVHPEPPRARLFQMAVVADMQGKGLGRRLVRLAEGLAMERSVTTMELHARRQRASFYEFLGYQPVGDSFFEIGIEHVLMEKSLHLR